MANHKLSLEVPTVMNACILSVIDTSVYSPLVPVTCPTLNVTAPGFSHSVQIELDPGFSQILTACDLQMQLQQCGQVYADLPDGIYIIKYSVSPNDLVYVEYNHLRITQALIKYNKILCNLDLAACEPSEKVKEKLAKLQNARMYLDSAKAKVEFCHEPQKGMTLYNYAIKLMNKIECKNC
jgi:hypothetical protein